MIRFSEINTLKILFPPFFFLWWGIEKKMYFHNADNTIAFCTVMCPLAPFGVFLGPVTVL